MIDPNLLEYCETERQVQFMQIAIRLNSVIGTARELGISERNARSMMQRIRKNASNRHYSPKENQDNPLPYGQTTRGVSQLVDEGGNVKMTWYKSKPKEIIIQEIIAQTLSEHQPKPFPIIKQPPKATVKDADCLDLLTFTDYHFGMLAWSQECGDGDWDLEIAEQTFYKAIDDMVKKAKISNNSQSAILNLQGDLLHYDSLEAVTPTSGHVLTGSDGRIAKIVELVMTCCEWAIFKLLEKYKYVHVVICEGNHDLYGSVWLRKHLKTMFRKNKRVSIDDTEFPYYAHLHGETMLGFHHGHKSKNKDLPSLFSAEPRYREMWGKASCCYIHTGHYHHREKETSENSGAVVERHPTLASRDSYATKGGYVSQRGANVITYHKTLGEIDRSRVLPILQSND